MNSNKLFRVKYRQKNPPTIYNEGAKITQVPAPTEQLVPDKLAEALDCSPMDIVIEEAEVQE